VKGAVYQRGSKWYYKFRGPEIDPSTGEYPRLTKGGFHTHAEPGGGVHVYSAAARQISAKSFEGIDHTAVYLNYAALQLGHIAVGQTVEHFRSTRSQTPGFQVDEVKFFLHS
jgi:hypothetical protein